MEALATAPIIPAHVRYIKLGRGGIWEDISLNRGELHFGHHAVPHDLGASADRERIREHLVTRGRDPRAATDDVREVIDFYILGSDCLWVTIANDHLWWTFAEASVTWLGEAELVEGSTRSSMDELASLTLAAEKVIVF